MSEEMAADVEDFEKFVEENWFYDPSKHGLMPELGYLGFCLIEELGEVAGKMKKAFRDNNGVVDSQVLAMELGDLLYYITKFSHLHGLSLGRIMRMNIEKLKSRRERGTLRGSGDDR